jgi:hypothetical protein
MAARPKGISASTSLATVARATILTVYTNRCYPLALAS